MQLTDVNIANMAIGRLGEGKPITSLAGGSQEAIWAATFLPIVKENLLASHPWSFARRSEALVAATVDDLPTGWLYAYTPPSDMVTPLSLWNEARRPSPETEYPFELAFATNGATNLKVLATDVLDPTLLYVTNALDETNDYPAPYLEAVAWALAAELVMPLGKKPELAISVRQMAERQRQIAVAFDLNSRKRDAEPDPVLLTGRL